MILKKILLFVAGIPVFIILVWFFAVPDNVLREKIESSISGGDGVSVSVIGFRKGVFLAGYADIIEVSVDGIPALTITGLEGSISPGHLLNGEIALSIKGKIGTGNISGTLKHPAGAEIHVDKAELNAVPYLNVLGIKSSGYVSADIKTSDNNKMKIEFRIPDIAITESHSMVPFMDTFHKTHGVLSVTGNTVTLESVGLEGEKGYARLKGDITRSVVDLRLELMPDMGKLTALESALIEKYQVSPGYFIVPVRGPVI